MLSWNSRLLLCNCVVLDFLEGCDLSSGFGGCDFIDYEQRLRDLGNVMAE